MWLSPIFFDWRSFFDSGDNYRKSNAAPSNDMVLTKPHSVLGQSVESKPRVTGARTYHVVPSRQGDDVLNSLCFYVATYSYLLDCQLY